MTPDAIGALVVALLGGSATGSVTSYVLARRREPIERETASAAASREIAEATTELLHPMRDEIARLGVGVREARQDASAARHEAEGLRRIVTDADDYINDLHARWDIHRAKTRPPFWRWLS